MILYVCKREKFGPRHHLKTEQRSTDSLAERLGSIFHRVGRALHPCARAASALDAAGYQYELKRVDGYRGSPWTWHRRRSDRAEVKRLSGTNEVPILVLDDGEVISGSSRIERWAKEHPHTS